MNDEQATALAYWLQGFVELVGTKPTEEQWLKIKSKFTDTRADTIQYLSKLSESEGINLC